ncbi:MAG: hypothetical protein KGY66_06205 [Candidatus Thermoplasmatota archaeon]|nr:hypothetical protein [Candidatus Thermoplasmatota archaeon]MBS3790491.1 hypothetical protein [Candidatus Thermoplasmatota archaeon]
MAKRWNEDDDDLDIDLEFDRVEYMKKEINKGKSTLVAVAIAPIFALVSMSVFNLTMHSLISLVTGMLGLIFLKPIYDILNIDIDKIDKKGWVKNGGVYFLTLLAVWIILMNPPFGDFADPQLNDVWVEVDINDNGEWIPVEDVNTTDVEEGKSYPIRIVAEITDNDAINENSVKINFENEGWKNMTKIDTHLYAFDPDITIESGTHNYEFRIRMEDMKGNSNSVNVDHKFTLEAS